MTPPTPVFDAMAAATDPWPTAVEISTASAPEDAVRAARGALT